MRVGGCISNLLRNSQRTGRGAKMIVADLYKRGEGV